MGRWGNQGPERVLEQGRGRAQLQPASQPHRGPLQVQGWAGASMTGRGLSLGPCLCPAPVILAREPAGGCVRRGGWGGQQGRQGPGCARACQRVPRVIYDVRPMSLSAGLFGAGCIQQLDRQAGFPPGPPSPFPLPLARAPRACLL